MKRSKFSLSHYKLFSCDMGELIPISVLEVLPGDSIQHATNALVRAAPLLAPVMHPVECHIRHFFVPNRLMWDDFEDFITGGPDGLDDTVHPYITMSSSTGNVGGLGDYLGLPDVPTGGVHNVSALPFRAYAMIYNDYYRDQDLQSNIEVAKNSGEDVTTSQTLLRCNWEKDYFTTARPWEQKGASLSVPVDSTYEAVQFVGQTDAVVRTFRGFSGGTAAGFTGANFAASNNMAFADQTGLSVDLGLIREAFAMQRFEEARARFGSRYVEYLRYLGVQSSDARLQRPEYLGGGKATIQFSEVLQTAEGTDPVGDLKGHGIAAMRSNRYRRFFEEHGLVISLMSVRPKPVYINALHKHWFRFTRDQYYTREFAHIGQEEILNKQIDLLHTTPDGVFGYQDRYDDYRRAFSSVAGEFRTSTLNYWHLGRELTDPALNSAFITCNPTERVFASSATDVLYVMARHSIQARRIVNRSSSQSFVY